MTRVAPTYVGGVRENLTLGTTAATIALSAVSGVATDDMIILAITFVNTNPAVTSANGWTQLYFQTINTRKWGVWYRRRQSGDGSSYSTPQFTSTGGGGNADAQQTAWRGVDWTQAVVSGTAYSRPSSINTMAPTGITVVAGTTAILACFEASNATENDGSETIPAGWTKAMGYGNQTVASTNIEHVLTMYQRVSADGSTGTPTVTWANAGSNGAAVQFGIVGLEPAPVTTGQVGAHGCFAVGTTYLTLGHDKLAGGTHEVVLFNAAGTTEISRQTVTFDGTTGWGSVTFTGLSPATTYSAKYVVAGDTQTDAAITSMRTLATGTQSFIAVAGSCQFTASNHPVFDVIRGESPVCVSHMGDIHYEDSTTESGWRAGMEASLVTPRMKAMLETLPMVWTPDNHDIIRTTPLGGGSPLVNTEWRQLAGTTGFLSSDSLGRAWTVGRVLFIQTDDRTCRDNYADGGGTVLYGAAQKAAFKALLTAAATDPTTALVVWLCGWTARNDSSGRWNSYPTETAELEAHIDSLPAVKAKLVMIGGDSHVLQADSGARTGSDFRFLGVPSLNISGFNRSSQYATGGWDIAEADLRTSGQPEADWGGYSRITITDNGSTLHFRWDAVRVNAVGATDVMATFERDYGTTPVASIRRRTRVGALRTRIG